MARHRRYLLGSIAGSLLMALNGCDQDTNTVSSQRAALVAVCADSDAVLPPDAWVCGAPRTVECDAQPGIASPSEIYVVAAEGCDDRALLVDDGPFALGERELVVSEPFDAVGLGTPDSREVCRSRLTVVDTTPPRGTPASITLWPPNHELHQLSARQCAGVVDACDPNVDVRFTGAVSDEPVDARGDGAHEPDIIFEGPRTVAVRAERQGGGNGRLYTLGWQARDSAGNAAEGTCNVLVPHDASGRSAPADPPAYRVAAPL